jgi:hypothetical protein
MIRGGGCRVPGARVLGALVLGAGFVLGTPLAAFAQQTHLLIVSGVEGDPEYGTQFHKWATALIDAAKKSDPDTDIVYLADKPAADPARITGRSTRETIEKTIAALAARSKDDEEVLIVLFGHGSYDGQQAAFNLPGPDLDSADWAHLLDQLKGRRVAFVDTTASSGAFLEPLAGPGRAIVTATKTGGERNETIFPQYFVEAFTAEGADQDRSGRVSLAEAFNYAKGKVEAAYGQQGTLLTEHATLEDGLNGQLATSMYLTADRARADAIAAVADPELRALMQKQRDLEQKVAGLRLLKPSMDPQEYDRQLQDLLTQLALATREVQQKQGSGSSGGSGGSTGSQGPR